MTDPLLGILAHLVFKFRSMGIVTVNAGHRQTGPRVPGLVPYRMGKLSLCFMAARTDIIAIATHQGKFIGAMYRVTLGAFLDAVGMHVLAGGESPKGILMAGSADLDLATAQQIFCIAGMGRVAVDAAIATALGYMAVDAGNLLADVLVAAGTGIHRHHLASGDMTGTAPLAIRLVQDVPDQIFPAAAVGVMAGETISHSHRECTVNLLHLVFLVTRRAQGIAVIGYKKHGVGCVVRLMAGTALPGKKRPVPDLELLLQFLVTGEAGGNLVPPDKTGKIRGMGRMAGNAFALKHRLMNDTGGNLCLFLIMTGITEPRPFLLEHTRIPGNMGIMA